MLPSAAAPLAVGDELTFGELDEVWVVDDVGSPGLVLWPLEEEISPIRVSAADGLQALPSPDEPTAMVLLRGTGQWSLEFLTGQRVELAHGAIVTLLGQSWRCEVSTAADETAESSRPIHTFSLASVSLTIRVAPDEETAELQVRGGALERPVGPSVPLYSLAYLARRRLRDGAELVAAGNARDDSPLSQAGWVATESACRDLRLSREQLGVHVYRVREVLKGIGLADAADVIERRRGWLRIGVDSGRLAVA